MHVELYCPGCRRAFVAPAEASEYEIRERMLSEEPWFPLGDGNTFEDMIFSALLEHGAISCPHCGDPVSVSEESLGQLALEMLESF